MGSFSFIKFVRRCYPSLHIWQTRNFGNRPPFDVDAFRLARSAGQTLASVRFKENGNNARETVGRGLKRDGFRNEHKYDTTTICLKSAGYASGSRPSNTPTRVT